MTAGKKIVVIGGGTGTYTVLTGLKEHPLKLTAVVSMADSGGSTGRLRDEFGILPPGDVRRALLALSDSPEQLLLRQLFEYRFDKGNGLSGHSFGNLLLTALTEILGNEVEAIQEAGKLLNIKGEVLPVTLTKAHLVARLTDGTLVRGETNIDVRIVGPTLKILDVFLDPSSSIYPPVQQVISEADLIVLGPGDLYTSIIPNLLVKGVPEAICQSSAKVVYVCNIMNKHGETDNFSVADYVREVEKYLGCKQKKVVDAIIANKSKYPRFLLEKYEQEKAFPVNTDIANVNSLAPQVLIGDFTRKETLLRHDPEKLTRAIISLL
ncbi:MAG: YvcK family protein [Candidatus Blackburnbacteria bacterium]|nr:YvcK family protein [Candidatus Blackburnbacteria bacterium]